MAPEHLPGPSSLAPTTPINPPSGVLIEITCRVILHPVTLVENAGESVKNHRQAIFTSPFFPCPIWPATPRPPGYGEGSLGATAGSPSLCNRACQTDEGKDRPGHAISPGAPDEGAAGPTLEGRILNSTAEALRLSALYRELEVRFSSLAALVNNQSLLIAALEERCLQVYWNHRREPLPPPLVQVVPRTAPATTGGLLDLQHPPQGNVSLEGNEPITDSLLMLIAHQRCVFTHLCVLVSRGPFRDCLQAMQAGHSTSGTYLLKPDGTETPVQAWCEHDVDRGGWTLIQRRKDGSVNFFRNWDSYKKGFGDVDGEHWLGLENIYNLGKQEDYKLLVELEDWMGKKVYAAYSSFHLEPESQAYRLCLGTYQGNAGDSLSSHNGKQFTTLDHDNDAFSGNCAHFHKAGWWYSACGQANLNGVWYSGGVYRSRFQDGVFWADYGGGFYSMKSVRMMIRPID
uniref:Angiopoietin-related protein 1-like n=1 Tax=Sinocyclocheilus anshuiensis TaxID=1608454 RepID=A0A671ND93_9TELE